MRLYQKGLEVHAFAYGAVIRQIKTNEVRVSRLMARFAFGALLLCRSFANIRDTDGSVGRRRNWNAALFHQHLQEGFGVRVRECGLNADSN